MIRRAEKVRSRWRAPSLLINLALFVFETVTGFILFFLGALLEGGGLLSLLHSWVGCGLIFTYAIYQWKHYLRVKNFRGTLHYTLGIFTFVSLLIVFVSGLMVMEDFAQFKKFSTIIDLVHVVSSFAFLIFISGHLVLVWKITIGRGKA